MSVSMSVCPSEYSTAVKGQMTMETLIRENTSCGKHGGAKSHIILERKIRILCLDWRQKEEREILVLLCAYEASKPIPMAHFIQQSHNHSICPSSAITYKPMGGGAFSCKTTESRCFYCCCSVVQTEFWDSDTSSSLLHH